MTSNLAVEQFYKKVVGYSSNRNPHRENYTLLKHEKQIRKFKAFKLFAGFDFK